MPGRRRLAALRFVDELTYQERDRVFLPAPAQLPAPGLRRFRLEGETEPSDLQLLPERVHGTPRRYIFLDSAQLDARN